jgi:glutamate--cysteine ligase catalytic subunit
MGWRVEFRSMEVQMTDFENAAFSIFMVLLSRAILTFGLNFYIPISKVG